MRLIIVNGHVVPGDGERVLQDHSVVIEDGMIAEVPASQWLPYDPADEVIDAGGGLIIPGVLNHHSHGGVFGGPFLFAGRPLPRRRSLANLDRHLSQGTTTLVNACGWPTMGEIENMNKLHPINIRASTNHTPAMLEHVEFVDGSGLKPWHRNMTVAGMAARGAVALGEAGAPFAAHGTPQIAAWLGTTVTVPQVHRLKLAALGPTIDPGIFKAEEVQRAIDETGLGRLLTVDRVREIMDRFWLRPFEMCRRSVADMAALSREHGLPVLFHNTRESFEMALELAEGVGERLICLHSNYTFGVKDAVECARELKKRGAWIDIFTSDSFGARAFHPSPEVAFALFKQGLVDLVTTDYIGGYWDSILLVLEKAVEAGLLGLAEAVAMTGRNVIRAIPRLGPDRGRIEAEAVADLVITDPGHLSRVRAVLVGGRVVVRDGRPCWR